jgi:AraC-like DNA-binding protein
MKIAPIMNELPPRPMPVKPEHIDLLQSFIVALFQPQSDVAKIIAQIDMELLQLDHARGDLVKVREMAERRLNELAEDKLKGSLQDRIVAVLREHPSWTSARIASEVGCHDAYVRTAIKRAGLKLAASQ